MGVVRHAEINNNRKKEEEEHNTGGQAEKRPIMATHLYLVLGDD